MGEKMSWLGPEERRKLIDSIWKEIREKGMEFDTCEDRDNFIAAKKRKYIRKKFSLEERKLMEEMDVDGLSGPEYLERLRRTVKSREKKIEYDKTRNKMLGKEVIEKGKIIDEVLLEMYEEGTEIPEIAKFFGVTESKVKNRLTVLKKHRSITLTTNRPFLENTIEKKLTAVQQMEKLHINANSLLDAAISKLKGDGMVDYSTQEFMALPMELQQAVMSGGKSEERDLRSYALKVMHEIREQIKLQSDIMEKMYSIQAVQEFQDSVIETLEEVDPDLRERAVKKLNAKMARRSVIFKFKKE